LWRISPDGAAVTCVATLNGHRDFVMSVAFHPTSDLLATGSFDKTAKLWRVAPDGAGATCVATMNEDFCPVMCVVFHPTLDLLATTFRFSQGTHYTTVRYSHP
jgi:WD40 repeat protein